LVCVFNVASAGAAADSKVRVLVEAIQPAPGQFVEVGQQRRVDSAKDIAHYLKPLRHISLVKRREDADVVVVVESSANEPGSGATAVAFVDPKTGLAVGSSRAAKLNTVRAQMRVGEYEKLFREQALSWSGAAHSIAKQVAEWAKDNQQAVIARRGSSTSLR
jgi:hypothetical protein